jgi:trehalose 6-phosphate synthase
LIVGVDRLDYTKGIPQRLDAFSRLLDLHPGWRGKVSMIQVSVPSRADIPEYREQRRLIEATVERINRDFGRSGWTPVRYLYRSYGRGQLVRLYRAGAVGMITPLRDGMNLVAKEYVAAQNPEDPGVLLLSRFAGAAVELSDALLTNPYHIDGMANDLDRALRMDAAERVQRHAKLRAAVERTTALSWAEGFVAALERCRVESSKL